MPRIPHLLLEALQELVTDLVVLVDPAGRIVLFNRACEILTGHTEAEVLGKNLVGLLVPPEWRRTVEQRFADPHSPDIVAPHENPWITRSGEARLINWRCTAVRTETGDQPYVLGIGTDVTEIRRIEETARTQTRLLEQFFESTLTCVVLLDREFNFVRVNQAYARACGRDVAEFPGRNHFDLYPSGARTIFEEVVHSREPHVEESYPFCFPDHPEWGTTYWDWTLVPVLDERDDIELLLFCLNDVTERMRGEMDLRVSNTRLRELSRQLVEVQEKERRRIARELHDEIGQGLTALKLALENRFEDTDGGIDPRVKQTLATAGSLFENLRRIAFDLRPPMLDDMGLLAALMWFSEKCRTQAGLNVTFRHNGLGARLPGNIETAIFRIAQEALNNVMRHAGVNRAEVAVWVTENTVVLRVQDQGRGFDPTGTHRSAVSAGLLGMEERATLLGGTLTIDTGIGDGTTITAEFPLRKGGSELKGAGA